MGVKDEIIENIKRAYDIYTMNYLFFEAFGDSCPFKGFNTGYLKFQEYLQSFSDILLFIDSQNIGQKKTLFNGSTLYGSIIGNEGIKKNNLIDLIQTKDFSSYSQNEIPYYLELSLRQDAVSNCYGIYDWNYISVTVLKIYEEVASLYCQEQHYSNNPLTDLGNKYKQKLDVIYNDYRTIVNNQLEASIEGDYGITLLRALDGLIRGFSLDIPCESLDELDTDFIVNGLFTPSNVLKKSKVVRHFERFIVFYLSQFLNYCDNEIFHNDYIRNLSLPKKFGLINNFKFDMNFFHVFRVLKGFDQSQQSDLKTHIVKKSYECVFYLTSVFDLVGKYQTNKGFLINGFAEIPVLQNFMYEFYDFIDNAPDNLHPSLLINDEASSLYSIRHIRRIDYDQIENIPLVNLLKDDMSKLAIKIALYSKFMINNFSKLFAGMEIALNGSDLPINKQTLTNFNDYQTIPDSLMMAVELDRNNGGQANTRFVYDSILTLFLDYASFNGYTAEEMSSPSYCDCFIHILKMLDAYNTFISNHMSEAEFLNTGLCKDVKPSGIYFKIESLADRIAKFYKKNMPDDSQPICKIIDAAIQDKRKETLHRFLFDQGKFDRADYIKALIKAFYVECAINALGDPGNVRDFSETDILILERDLNCALDNDFVSAKGCNELSSGVSVNGNDKKTPFEAIITAIAVYADTELHDGIQFTQGIYFTVIELFDFVNEKIYDIDFIAKFCQADFLKKFRRIIEGTLRENLENKWNTQVSKDFLEVRKSLIRDEDKLNKALEDVNSLIGLAEVKNFINNKVSEIRAVQRAMRYGQTVQYNTNISMIFVGNPGTGKTKVGQLIADILYQLGILKNNKVIRVVRSDLVQQYIGHTEEKTKEYLNKSEGGILFVDEAYQLFKDNKSNDFGKAALETIMDAMEQNPDKYTVIFAGYEKDMQRIMDANAGLKSRFRNIVHFEDYNNKECYEIFKEMFESNGNEYSFDEDVKDLFYTVMDEERRNNPGTFGNGRTVRTVYEKVYSNFIQRGSEEGFSNEIKAVDFNGLIYKKKPAITFDNFIRDENSLNEALQRLNSLIGLDEVKQAINEKYAVVRAIKEAEMAGVDTGIDDFSISMVFTGNPGTGKTTVGELVAEIFYQLGYLQTNTVTRMVKNTVTSIYKGGAIGNTKNLLEKSKGGILFIDEILVLRQEKGLIK